MQLGVELSRGVNIYTSRDKNNLEFNIRWSEEAGALCGAMIEANLEQGDVEVHLVVRGMARPRNYSEDFEKLLAEHKRAMEEAGKVLDNDDEGFFRISRSELGRYRPSINLKGEVRDQVVRGYNLIGQWQDAERLDFTDEIISVLLNPAEEDVD